MRHLRIAAAITLSLCACTSAGKKGDAGAIGPSGAQGAQGSAGICDATTCPQVTSIEGLAGGALTSPVTVSDVTVSDTLNANRVVVTKGAQSVSLSGFFCGFTDFTVNGNALKSAATESGMRAAKTYCEQTCGKPTAHMCTTQELLVALALSGGSRLANGDTVVGTNPDVPMPPLDPKNGLPAAADFQRGWVLSSNGFDSCGLMQGVPGSTSGVVFIPDTNGGLLSNAEACTQQHPLYCCN